MPISLEVLGVVGESGSGKSTLGYAIGGLLEPRVCDISGVISFADSNQEYGDTNEVRRSTSANVGFIFQDPHAALNPLLKIGKQIIQPLQIDGKDKETSWNGSIELLRNTRIVDPERCMHQYPHELSGGMRQRVVVAAAIARRPRLLVADEPTTALDVTIQAQIITLLQGLISRHSMSLIFISQLFSHFWYLA